MPGYLEATSFLFQTDGEFSVQVRGRVDVGPGSRDEINADVFGKFSNRNGEVHLEWESVKGYSAIIDGQAMPDELWDDVEPDLIRNSNARMGIIREIADHSMTISSRDSTVPFEVKCRR